MISSVACKIQVMRNRGCIVDCLPDEVKWWNWIHWCIEIDQPDVPLCLSFWIMSSVVICSHIEGTASSNEGRLPSCGTCHYWPCVIVPAWVEADSVGLVLVRDIEKGVTACQNTQ